MNGFGNGGGYGGGGNGRPPFGAGGMGSAFGGALGAPTRAPALTAIPGGAHAQGARPRPVELADPPPPHGLRDFVVRCHAGKRVDKDTILDWRALQLSDTADGVIHEEPYLPPETLDDELVHMLWERIKARLRLYDDALPHHFLLVIYFADAEGLGLTANESHDIGPVQLPRTNGEWGAQTGMQQRAAFGPGMGGGLFGRGGGMQHPAQHLAMQEIEAAALHHAGVRENYAMFGQFMRMYESRLSKAEEREVKVMELFQELMEDKVKQIREQQTHEMKMELLKGAFAKCLPMIQLGGLQLMDTLKRKFDKRPAKTPREMQSFSIIKRLADGAQNNGMSQDMLWGMIEGVVGKDPAFKDDLTAVMMEIAVDGQRAKAEAQIKADLTLANLLGPKGGDGSAPTPQLPSTPTEKP